MSDEKEEGFHNLRKHDTDKWLFGVCGGIARALDMPSWLVRMMFVLVAGNGLCLVYLLLAAFLPEDTTDVGSKNKE